MYPQGTAGTQTHIIHFHAHTNTRTSHTQPRALTHTQTQTALHQPVLPFPAFLPLTHPHLTFVWPRPHSGYAEVSSPPPPETGEKNVPGAPYLLFFVPLLVPSFAFWAGGANGEMAN